MATYNKKNFLAIMQALANAGFSGKDLLFALAQSAHETKNYTDEKITSHNNPSGITFINNPDRQKNATKGRPLPENPKYSYAKFKTLNDWAKDYKRIIGKAITSSSDTTSYATALGAKGYFEVSPRYPKAIQHYAEGLDYHLKNIQRIIIDNINTFTGLNLPAGIKLVDNSLPIAPSTKDSKNNTISPILVAVLALIAFSFF